MVGINRNFSSLRGKRKYPPPRVCTSAYPHTNTHTKPFSKEEMVAGNGIVE